MAKQRPYVRDLKHVFHYARCFIYTRQTGTRRGTPARRAAARYTPPAARLLRHVTIWTFWVAFRHPGRNPRKRNDLGWCYMTQTRPECKKRYVGSSAGARSKTTTWGVRRCIARPMAGIATSQGPPFVSPVFSPMKRGSRRGGLSRRCACPRRRGMRQGHAGHMNVVLKKEGEGGGTTRWPTQDRGLWAQLHDHKQAWCVRGTRRHAQAQSTLGCLVVDWFTDEKTSCGAAPASGCDASLPCATPPQTTSSCSPGRARTPAKAQ